MQKDSASIKPVRHYSPANGASKVSVDSPFQNWWHKSWDSFNIEIGCGAGLHPIRYAQLNPSHAHLALERTKIKYRAFEQRVTAHNLPNLWPVNADACDWLPKHIEENSIDQCFLLLPNPYPKERQANKRWHRAPFFAFIIDILKPRGRIHLATNELWYAKEFALYCSKFWNLQILQSSVRKGVNLPSRTHFEKKYLKVGQSIYDVIVQKQ